jgi:GNAT superfamily N-acetyltransferase
MMRAEVSLRAGTAADVASAAAIQCASALVAYAHIFPDDAPKPTPESLVPMWSDILRWDPPGTIVAAERDGRVIGVAVAHIGGGSDVGAISKIYVLPDEWGVGVGDRLLGAALDAVRDGGARVASLWVLERNARARGWYERRGWSRTGAARAPFAGLDRFELEYRLAL